jgi:hypothetical protein
VAQQLEEAVRRARQCRGRLGAPDLAVVIDGRALAIALDGASSAKFLELGVACKVGPTQPSQEPAQSPGTRIFLCYSRGTKILI